MKNRNIKKLNLCKNCGKVISRNALRCKSCVKKGIKHPGRKRSLRKEINLEEVRNLYTLEDKTSEQIAKIYGTTGQTIVKRLNLMGIKINKNVREGNKKHYTCKDCGKKIIRGSSKRCKKCYILLLKKKSKEKRDNDFLKGFRILMNKISQGERLKKIGFKKGCIVEDYGFRFKKGHKTNVGKKKGPPRKETRIKMSATKQGITLSKWEGFSKDEYDERWTPAFRNSIRKRDNQVCMNCGIHREKLKVALSVHHINSDKKLSIPENCVCLCTSCHALTFTNREYWQKLFQEKLSKIYNYYYSEDGKIILNFNRGDINGVNN